MTDNRFLNVVLLGTAFMVLFTAFQATGMISVYIDCLKILNNEFYEYFLCSKVCWKESKMKLEMVLVVFMEVVISGEN
jgi:hypothetical protein